IDRGYPQGTNFEQLAAEQQLVRFDVADDAQGSKASAMRGLFSSELKFIAAERLASQPGLIGQTVALTAPLSDDANLYLKGQMSRATPSDQRRLSDMQIDWLDRMKAEGQIAARFNTGLVTRGASTQPE